MAAEIRAQLRKSDFPAVVVEALNHLQKMLTTPANPNVVDICNEILEEFVFQERRRKKLSAVRELHLLDVMCTCFQTMSRENSRNLFFVMFPATDRAVLDRRLSLLSKLISLAITLNVDVLLDCAAFWLHMAGIDGEISLQLARQLLHELFDGSAELNGQEDSLGPAQTANGLGSTPPAVTLPPTALQLIQSSPAFCATFVTAITFLYPTSTPPRVFLHLLSAWLESNLFLAFVPFESVTPSAQTFVPGFVAWTTLAGTSTETSAGVKGAAGDEDRLDLTNESDVTLVNRLHLTLLKIILKAPPATLQADHLMKLAHSLHSRTAADVTADGSKSSSPKTWRIERFLQVVQAGLSCGCIHGTLRGLKTALQQLPPTQLTSIVLETNKKALLA